MNRPIMVSHSEARHASKKNISSAGSASKVVALDSMVGSSVGKKLGMANVGSTLGSKVGGDVGSNVGSTVGVNVGAMVVDEQAITTFHRKLTFTRSVHG